MTEPILFDLEAVPSVSATLTVDTAEITGVEFNARATDPASSHEAAGRAFDTPARLPDRIAGVLARRAGEWFTSREIIDLVFGPGPYTYAEAVALNKVQTVCLQLHRAGHLLRNDEGDRVAYCRAPF